MKKIKYRDVNLENGYNNYDFNGDLIILNQLPLIEDKFLNLLLKSENKNVLIIPDLKKSLQYENLFQFLKLKNYI